MSDLSDREMRAAFRDSGPDSSILRRLGIVAPVHRPRDGETESAGRYRIGEEIARGGVGVVFRGHDIDLGRDVAMKVLRDEYCADAAAKFPWIRVFRVEDELNAAATSPAGPRRGLPPSATGGAP